jgi:hypothetical protein
MNPPTNTNAELVNLLFDRIAPRDPWVYYESIRRCQAAGFPYPNHEPLPTNPARAQEELRKRGFERFTADYMHDNWDIGRDDLKAMAYLAYENGKIEADYELPKFGKSTELWARRKA